MSTVQEQWKSWFNGIQGEINFWTQWAETKGGDWPDDFKKRMDANTQLDDYVAASATSFGRKFVHILDVGSGPITGLGYKSDNLICSITACDPLAQAYDLIFSTFDLHPPVRTEFATAEDLSSFYLPRSFDIVHCRNALDHSFDPLRGIMEMLTVVRLGGELILKHSRNEAENERYSGFHQFNIDEINGRLVIWNKQRRYDLHQILEGVAEIILTCDNSQVWARIVKIGDPIREKASDRLADLAKGMVGWMIDKSLHDQPPTQFVSLARLREKMLDGA
ncbi:class I SAM-dependent methyltransferase [Methylobacterium radiotolerans]|uniref:class I SAM-dependent methyltransferase n=1 Tax=Methylobacterium radiotolerans TaxID=31998 RepID=UPI001F31F3A6|nr:methyltransferase domain-containing protein [Methylobacterium radiotolerans]UIY43254.1 class I SAM-dependent methyltransferase [Methylobacterium radiotolerans]